MTTVPSGDPAGGAAAEPTRAVPGPSGEPPTAFADRVPADGLPIDLPEVHAEVSAVFARYEQALVENRLEVLDELFWASAKTVRYGAAENLLGIDAIRAFRASRPSAGLARELRRTTITTYGRDFATAMTEFHREGDPRVGRQSQTWVRMRDGWHVVAAHVSLIAAPR